jgi:5-methylcytosine-specific restriction enzyme A
MTKQPRLSLLGPRVTMASQRLEPRPKQVDQYYLTPQHREWRTTVCRRAGWQCEAIEDGRRCAKSAANGHRMFADHIHERLDGGPDMGAGRCLCGSHHTPRRRYASAPGGLGNKMWQGGWRGWGFNVSGRWGAESAWGILL